MNTLLRFCLSIVFISLSTGLFSQDCGCNQCQIAIVANVSRDFYLDIFGATFNDLSTPQQALCEVEIDFAHDFLTDLTMSLVSPSGQSVQLVRDVNPNDTTYFSRWKIKFKPCADQATPDLGMQANFDDNTNWPKNGNLLGSYYPSTGCLEDFNTGTVNGRWTLKVSSQNLRGLGYIYGFKLKFCQQQGIACAGLSYDLSAGDDCFNAAELPSNLLTYVGNTTGFNPSGAFDFCGTSDNDQWFKFVASCEDITVQLTPGFCANGNGIQIALYDECNMSPIACDSGCTECGWKALTIQSTLTIGEEYYLMIDGWAGDLCDFEFTVPPGCFGSIGDPDISGTPTGCEGSVYLAELTEIPFGAAGYIWTANNGALVNGQTQVTIPGPQNTSVEVTLGNGISQVCVAAYNFTDTTQFYCESIEADTNLFLVENATLCYDEFPFYSAYIDYGVPPLNFPGTRQFSLYDYPDENGDPYPCPVTLTIHLIKEGGYDQLPPVVGLGDQYVLPNGDIVSQTSVLLWSDTLPSGCRFDHSQSVNLIPWTLHGDGCAPDTITFDMPGNGVVLQCQGGNPAFLLGNGPQNVVYENPGVFDLTAKIGNQTFLFEDTVKFNFSPATLPNFSLSTNQATITCTNNSQNATSYLWNFGDGSTSTEFEPTHSYTSSGIFTITLTATGICGSKTVSKTVSIQGPAPQAAFQTLQNNGCTPFVVQYQDQSQGNPTSWSWTFPGGTPATSTEQNPSVTYTNPGTYNATLSASNSFGSNVSTQTNLITVHPATTATFAITQLDSIIATINTSQNATDYLWDFGDGSTSTDSAPTHIYAAPGTYTITLTANGICGPITQTQTVTVDAPAPLAVFQALPSLGCVPLIVDFQDQSQGNPSSWNWTFPGGTPASSTEQNPTVIYLNPGVFDVVLTVENAFGTNTSTQTALISTSPLPTVAFGITFNDLEISLSNQSQNANTYLWDFGDGTTSTESAPTHIYAASGTYTITLTANGICGPSTQTQTVTVEAPAPLAVFQALPSLGCVPLIVDFQDQSQGNPSSWSWTFPGGTPASSTEQNPSVIYLNPGVFDVILTVENAFGTNTSTQTALISTSPLPTVAFGITFNDLEISLSNQSQNANSYSWDFGDGTTSTETNPTHTYAAPGEYLVTLQAINTCGNSILQQLVTAQTSGAASPTAIAWLSISPNPSNGHYQLELRDEPSSALGWRLFNSLGQNIAERNLGKFEGYYAGKLDFESLPSAMYWLEIRTAEKRSWVKLVKE